MKNLRLKLLFLMMTAGGVAAAQSNDNDKENTSQLAFADASDPALVVGKNAPFTDIRHKSYDFSKLWASKQSSDGVVVLYNGDDEAKMAQVRQGAYDAEKENKGIKHMYIGPEADDFTDDDTYGDESLVIYYKKIDAVRRVAVSGPDIREAVKNAIMRVHNDLIAFNSENGPVKVGEFTDVDGTVALNRDF